MTASGIVLGRDLTLPVDVVTRTTAIVGQRGTGKTSTAVVLVEEAAAAGAQFVVVDPTGAWYGLRSSADGKKAGLPVVVFGGHHADVPLEHASGDFLARVVMEQHVNAVLDLELMTKGQQVQFVATFAEALYHRNRSALTLVMDEAHRFAPQQLRDPGGFGARCLGAVTDVVTLGRRKGLGAVLISQRPAKINKDVFEQAEVMIVHRLMGPNDRKAIAGWLDDVAGEGDVAVLNREVPRLAPQKALVYAPHYGVQMLLEVRKKRTFDSSATPEVGASVIEPKGRADVDLHMIRQRMASIIEKAKADDPAVLKATIKRLRDQLAEAVPPEPVKVEVHVVPPSLRSAIDQAASAVKKAQLSIDLVAETMLGVELAMPTGREEMYGMLDDVRGRKRRPPLRVHESSDETLAEAAARVDPASPARGRVAIEMGLAGGNASNGAVTTLKAGARRMVAAVARYHPTPITKRQMAALAGMKVTSGTFRNYMGDIRKGGYVVEDADGLHVTEAGFVMLGERPSPLTPDDLRALWAGFLKLGARNMLDYLILRQGEWVPREDLAAAVDMSPTSGTFRNYLGDLKMAGLTESEGGSVRAGDVLFMGVTT